MTRITSKRRSAPGLGLGRRIAPVLAALVCLQAGRLLTGSELPPTGGRETPRVEYASFQQRRLSFDGGVGWINTDGPIHLEKLRGKIVLLDFWTYCCINCHHVLPDLEYLENKYKNQIVVIGVHTAKFEGERDTERIRNKVREYKIKHPVVNDANQAIWNRFAVNSWPTLVVIGPDGNYLDRASGEGNRQALDAFIQQVITHYKAKGEIDETPVQFYSESEKPYDGGLLYPGKVLADAKGKRLFISDNGHHRIVVTGLDGAFQYAIGNGEPALRDGGFDSASLNRPQGMCLVGDTLYIADTENHAIRAADLASKSVRTVAGTGKQGYNRVGGPALTTSLNSPWDLLPYPSKPSTLVIAMAGPHQIWSLDLEKGTLGVLAGSGIENIQDGEPAEAQFAQPSGLATDGSDIFVADSEVSGVRSIATNNSDRVSTIVGVGLFGFGDKDGKGSAVRLQHCLGLAYGDGKLFIADTYNNRVKVCDPATKSVQALVGNHKRGKSDSPAHFDEPGGLSYADGKLYVADTNNHAIRLVDVATKKVSTISTASIKAPVIKRRPKFANAKISSIPAARTAPGKSVGLDLTFSLPTGYKLSPEAPLVYFVESEARDAFEGAAGEIQGEAEVSGNPVKLELPLNRPAKAGDTLSLKVSASAFICLPNSLCTVKNYVWLVPVTFAADGAARVAIGASATDK